MTLTNLKICGITSRETACFCASKGVGALGAVFYEKSPRYVTPAQARAFFNELPLQIARVGVFVDLPPTTMIAIAREAQLNTLQLHGEESSETLHALMQTPYRIIKVLKSTGEKLLKQATTLPPQVGILLECGQGTLPGGMALFGTGQVPHPWYPCAPSPWQADSPRKISSTLCSSQRPQRAISVQALSLHQV